MQFRMSKRTLSFYRTFAQSGRVIAFDTETTGISCDDEIIQIAAVEYVAGERTRSLDLYIKPTCPIHPQAEAVHHISQEFLDVHGLAPVDALAQFFEFLGADVLAVGHNVNFDLRMLKHECRKFKFKPPAAKIDYGDTLALARKLIPGLPHYRLGNLIEAFELSGSNSHDALDDAAACGELFFDLAHRIPTPGEYTYLPLFEG